MSYMSEHSIDEKNKIGAYLTREQYLSYGGTRCPGCVSDDISAKDNDIPDGMNTTQKVECNYCGLEWKDIFELKNYELE